jgi:hypothetical protein
MKGWHVSMPEHMVHTVIVENEISRNFDGSEKKHFAGTVDHKKTKIKVLSTDSTKQTHKKKSVKFVTRLENRLDSITERLGRIKPHYNNKAFLVTEYTTFSLALLSSTLACIAVNNYIKLITVFVQIGVILFLIAVILSLTAQYVIKNRKLDYKISPHAFISKFALSILLLGISGVLALIIALITGDLVITVAGGILIFAILMFAVFAGMAKDSKT